MPIGMHWTPEFESTGNRAYTLWADERPMYLLSKDNEEKWELFNLQGVEGAVRMCNWETLERAKQAAEILVSAKEI